MAHEYFNNFIRRRIPAGAKINDAIHDYRDAAPAEETARRQAPAVRNEPNGTAPPDVRLYGPNNFI